MKVGEYVKQYVSILDVVGSYTDLKQKGGQHTGLCPIHGEKTPSLVVTPGKGYWHCFGACATGGDLIKFVQLMEGVSFMDAARILVERYSIPPPVRVYRNAIRTQIRDLEQQGRRAEAVELLDKLKRPA